MDGACRGNPGPASYGVCIYDESGEVVSEIGETIGTATNSIAEYSALERALKEGLRMGAEELYIFTDSQLVARQYEGIYRVKHEPLQRLLSMIRALAKEFKIVQVTHIPRSSHPGNKRADQLANIALNRSGY